MVLSGVMASGLGEDIEERLVMRGELEAAGGGYGRGTAAGVVGTMPAGGMMAMGRELSFNQTFKNAKLEVEGSLSEIQGSVALMTG